MGNFKASSTVLAHGIDMSATTSTTGFGAGFVSDNDSKAPTVSNINGRIITKLYVDLTGNTSKNTANDIIGDSGGGAAYIYRHVNTVNGFLEAVYITCMETPTTGDDDIDIMVATAADGAYDAGGAGLAGAAVFLETAEAWAIGVTRVIDDGAANGKVTTKDYNNHYFYLTSGNGDTAGEYGAGKFLITIVGNEVF